MDRKDVAAVFALLTAGFFLSTLSWQTVFRSAVLIAAFGGPLLLAAYLKGWKPELPVKEKIMLESRFHLQKIIELENTRSILTALSFASVHFFLQWRFTHRYIRQAGGLSLLKVQNAFLTHGPLGVFEVAFQINNYTGNPVIFLPVLKLLGYSPAAVRTLLIGCFAVSTGIFFLANRKFFGYRKAVLGALLYLSFSEFVYFRWYDYTYVFFFLSVLFYIYAVWYRSDQKLMSPSMIALSFIGGLFFYFKATVLWLMAGFASAILQIKRRDLISVNTAVCILIFVSGAAPFLVYTASNFQFIEDRKYGSNDVSVAGPENFSVPDALLTRFDQMGRWMHSDIYNLERMADGAENAKLLFGYEFTPFYAPGGESSEPISLRAFLTGEGYNYHASTGFHPVTAGLLLALPLILWRRRHVHLAMISAAFFSLMIFLPSTSGFRIGHMNVLVPFAVTVILAGLDSLPQKIQSSKLSLAAAAIFSLLLMTSTVYTATTLEPTSPRDSFPIDDWGGDQIFYQDYNRLDLTPMVYTNSYKVSVISKYQRDSNAYFIRPSNMSIENMSELPGTGGHENGLGYRGKVYPEKTPQVSVVLRKNQPCIPRKEFCGASNKEVAQHLRLNLSEMREVKLADHFFLIGTAEIQRAENLSLTY